MEGYKTPAQCRKEEREWRKKYNPEDDRLTVVIEDRIVAVIDYKAEIGEIAMVNYLDENGFSKYTMGKITGILEDKERV